MMPQRNQEKDSNSDVNLVLNLEGRGSGSKNVDFYRQISEKNSIFSGNFIKEHRVLQANFRNLDFFRQLKKFDFPSTKLSIYSYLWGNYSISLQSNHFRTYLLYMIRYNIS